MARYTGDLNSFQYQFIHSLQLIMVQGAHTFAVILAVFKHPGLGLGTVVATVVRLGVVAVLLPVAVAVAADGRAVAPLTPLGEASVH